jgi:hypothetical protein
LNKQLQSSFPYPFSFPYPREAFEPREPREAFEPFDLKLKKESFIIVNPFFTLRYFFKEKEDLESIESRPEL